MQSKRNPLNEVCANCTKILAHHLVTPNKAGGSNYDCCNGYSGFRGTGKFWEEEVSI